MATYPSSHRPPVETESGAFYKVAALLLGLTAGVVGIFAVLMWADARDDASAATPAAAVESAGGEAADQHAAADHNTALPLASFAGVVPENAAELAEAHKPYDATLPPAPTGDGGPVPMTL